MRTLGTAFVAVVMLLIVSACDDSGNGTNVDTFDRSAMLRGVVDSFIAPSLAEVAARANTVATEIGNMSSKAAPTDEEIVEIRTAISELTFQWQRVMSYNFGPADGALGSMVENVATFPANTNAIDELIRTGDTTFQNFQRDTRGLCALDYLFFRAPVSSIRESMSGDNATNIRNYAKAVANAIRTEVVTVESAWNGTYRQQFLASTGTDAGSSVSLLFNHFNIAYELLKNFKISLPLGKRAGQQNVEPLRVEAYYQTTSLELAHEQFMATKDLWYGRTRSGSTIPSFRSYLKTVVNGERLIADTEAQIALVEKAFVELGTTVPLSTLVTTNPAACEPLFVESQKLTKFFKSEMSSLLGIAITYSSGDGD